MEIINIAEQQMKATNWNTIDQPFFKEYFRLFNANENFREDTNQFMRTYSLHDVSETVSLLESHVIKIINQIKGIFQMDIDLDMITFFGDCSFDGHGILIDGKPSVFFDLNAVIPRLDIYNFKAFITHEILHAVHYDINPRFYRENYRTVEERYFKLLLAEGIATHLSFVISQEKIEDVYWFGYLEQDQVREWVSNCKRMKSDIGNDLRQAIEADKLDDKLYNRLFGIDDFDKITSYRTGYYYGSEIVQKLLTERSMNEILTLDYNEARKIIYDYF